MIKMNTIQLLSLMVMFGMIAAEVENEGDVKPLKEGVIYQLESGKYMLPKFNVSIVSIFASSTLTAESEVNFYITFSNSTVMEDKGLWWRALFLRESYEQFLKKVSPFEDLFFKIEFVSDTNVVETQIKFAAVDFRKICLFITGIMLFFVARRLSRSVLFHYSSGASIGMLMSWMIILVLLYRLLPYRRAMTTLLVTGTGAGFYFTEMLFNKGYQLVVHYPYEVIGVCSFFGLLSMALIYYFGPPSTEKSYNLIQWSLQMCAIYLIYQSSYCKEFSVTAIITVIFLQFISVYSILIKIVVLVTPRRVYYYFNRPEKIRFLTLEEYEEQGRVETEKALKELSSFCASPDCNSWRVVSKLKDPKRFARFLNEDEQFTTEELDAYDQFEVSADPNSLLDDDSDHSLDSAISETWLTDDDIHHSRLSQY